MKQKKKKKKINSKSLIQSLTKLWEPLMYIKRCIIFWYLFDAGLK